MVRYWYRPVSHERDEAEIREALSLGKEPIHCPKCGAKNYLKIEAPSTPWSMRLINSNPDQLDLSVSRPGGYSYMKWNCGRQKCQALNFIIWLHPPPKEPKRCEYCKELLPEDSRKCPNCGASL